jgi:hypothetical protein
VLYVGENAFIGSRLKSVSLPNARVVGNGAFILCWFLVCESFPKISYFEKKAFSSWPQNLYLIRLGDALPYSVLREICGAVKILVLPEAHKYDAAALETISSSGQAMMKFVDLPIDCEVKTVLDPSGVVTIRMGSHEFLDIQSLVGKLSDFKPLDSEPIDNFIDALRDCHKELTNYGDFSIDLHLKIDVSGRHVVHNEQRSFVYEGQICFLFEFLSENSKEDLSRVFCCDSDFEKLKKCLNDDLLKDYWRQLIGLNFIRNKKVIADIRINGDDDAIRKNEMRELVEKTAKNLRAVIE